MKKGCSQVGSVPFFAVYKLGIHHPACAGCHLNDRHEICRKDQRILDGADDYHFILIGLTHNFKHSGTHYGQSVKNNPSVFEVHYQPSASE